MNEELLLTVDEAARRLHIGRSLLYLLVQRNDIASIKLGRARRIPVTALMDFVAKQMEEVNAFDAL